MKVNPAERRKARHYGMQALYQWSMTGASASTIEAEFRTDNDMTYVDTDYLHELISEITKVASSLDEAYQPYLQGRNIEELDPITKALLRLGSYELLHRIDIPYKVAINESVALGKKFGANESYKFINGVLDQLAAKVRAVEVAAQSKK